jgi:hypothetical protein
MNKILLLATTLLCLAPHQLRAECVSVPESLAVSVPAAEFMGSTISFSLTNYYYSADTANLYFTLAAAEVIAPASSTYATVEPTLDIYIPCVDYQGTQFAVYFSPFANPADPAGYYWKLVSAAAADPQGNRQPYAAPLSLKVDSTLPYIQQQLAGSDPDHDAVVYELLSPTSGTGYSAAYINPNSGMLYLTHKPDGNEAFSISYRVTDGQLFSDPAEVSVTVDYISADEKNTGKIDVAPLDYSEFQLSAYNSDLLGSVGESPGQPTSIDLSANFPEPGDQGRLSSCVGWATAYALKSYQEKLEIGWSLNTPSHLFSPAFVYNQINAGQDQGSYIFEALDLAVAQGISTLATMPYSDTNYLDQPTATATAEAAQYKAARWSRVNDTSQIKAALANRKPVVVGIKVYQQLQNLQGPASVYNTASGNNLGGHAVTIVGYDDNKYGGSFKVINSWGVNWGDNGYFWMPYAFAAREVLSEAYVLEDAENTTGPAPAPDDPTEPEPVYETLPNLTVASWNASYDPRPRGEGSLTYTIANTGSGLAPQGADVNLMLSANAEISGNDYYVIYEPIVFDLQPGETVYRDENNAIGFRFPDQLPAGTYYMALWVDDLDRVSEANENDNISLGDSEVTIENSLPDLSVNNWYAEWDYFGNGSLTYEVINSGASTTSSSDWYVNLILDQDQTVGNGNEYYLFFEQAGYYLEPGQYLYRNQFSAAYFNLYYDQYFNPIPTGVYFLALWVDDLNSEAESNEMNNGSYSWGQVSISPDSFSAERNQAETPQPAAKAGRSKAYNGRKLPSRNLVMKKVEISRGEAGQIAMKFLEEEQSSPQTARATLAAGKTIREKTGLVFPASRGFAMPGGDASHGD